MLEGAQPSRGAARCLDPSPDQFKNSSIQSLNPVRKVVNKEKSVAAIHQDWFILAPFFYNIVSRSHGHFDWNSPKSIQWWIHCMSTGDLHIRFQIDNKP